MDSYNLFKLAAKLHNYSQTYKYLNEKMNKQPHYLSPELHQPLDFLLHTFLKKRHFFGKGGKIILFQGIDKTGYQEQSHTRIGLLSQG